MQNKRKSNKRVYWDDYSNNANDIPSQSNQRVPDAPITNIPITIQNATVNNANDQEILGAEHNGNDFSQNVQEHDQFVQMENIHNEHVQEGSPEQLHELRQTYIDTYATEHIEEKLERDSAQHSVFDFTNAPSMGIFGDHSSPEKKRFKASSKVQTLSTAQRKKQEAIDQAYAEIDERSQEKKQEMALAETRKDTETFDDGLNYRNVDLTNQPEIESDLTTNAPNDYTAQPDVVLVESLESRIKELENAAQRMENNEKQMAHENNTLFEKCKLFEEMCRKVAEHINSITVAHAQKEIATKLMHDNELEILQKQLQTERENNQKLKDELTRSKRFKNEAEMMKFQIEQKYTQLSDRFIRCEKDICRYREERNDAQSELEREKKKHDSTVRNLRTEIGELEKQLSHKEANLSTERKTDANVKQEMAEMDRLQFVKRDNTSTNHQAHEVITLDDDEEYELQDQFDSPQEFISSFGQSLMSSTSQDENSEAERSSFQALDFESNQEPKFYVDRSNVSGSNQLELTEHDAFLTHGEFQSAKNSARFNKSSNQNEQSKSIGAFSSTKHKYPNL